MPAHSHRTNSNARTQCLLLAPRGRQTPPEIIEGLRQRGVEVCEVNDPPAVMVALARRNIATLVIIEPAVWPRLDELVEAIRKYYPRIAMWQYRAEAQPRLSHYAAPEAQAALRQTPIAPPVKQGRMSGTAPKPATIDMRPPPPGPGKGMHDLLAQDDLRLTEEELTMLLGDDDVGPAHGPAS